MDKAGIYMDGPGELSALWLDVDVLGDPLGPLATPTGRAVPDCTVTWKQTTGLRLCLAVISPRPLSSMSPECWKHDEDH